MFLRGPARLQLPEQGVPVQDERLQRVRVHVAAREDRLRRGLGRRRRQSGDVPVLLGLEGAQEEVLLSRGQLQSLVLAGAPRPQSSDQERVLLPGGWLSVG